ncbi:TniQ family protein [Paraburkholderia caribensis]|uniref:TniQ family protein n=1 Tax=Paraburkholderia TaxID=1822464 RepID=UPI001CB0DEC6|nr:TniQ family protein [Paraburkholderia caribensis]BEU25794.1 TniQ family protein [Paraburkholderia sp. 22B1P]CAG9250908.1 hypothetical protein PCAR4_290061 [Paraburkholderia caribensis]
MTTYFFAPYDDEHLLGVQSRFYRQMSLDPASNPLGKYLRLGFGSMPPLDQFEKETFHAWGLRWDEIGWNLTLLPFLTSRCPPEKRASLIASFRKKSKPMTRHVAVRPRYCEHCFEEDQQAGRDEYWRRSHQLPGCILCHRHGCWLAEMPDGLGYAERLDPDLRVRQGSDLGVQLEPSQKEHCVELAVACHRMMFDDSVYWSRSPSMKRRSENRSRFVDFYGSAFLDRLAAMGTTHGATTMRNVSSRFFGTTEEILWEFFVRSEARVSTSEWPYCISQFAAHGPQKMVSHVSLLGGLMEAICECGMRFEFDGLRDNIASGVRILRYGPEYADEAVRLRKCGHRQVDIARILGVRIGIVGHWIKRGVDEEFDGRLQALVDQYRHAIRKHGSQTALRQSPDGYLLTAVKRNAPECLHVPRWLSESQSN